MTVGAVGLFGFLYTLLTKFIPIVSLWEYKEGETQEWVVDGPSDHFIAVVREETIG